MAGTEKFHPDTDWWVATSSSIGGKTAFTPDVNATIVGGGGDATAANQTTQITAEQAILAKLPTVGTAGTASTNVITVQGIASGTPVIVGGGNAVGTVYAGNTVGLGGIASTTTPTSRATGEKVDAWFNLNGALVVSGQTLTGADGSTNTLSGFMIPTSSTANKLAVCTNLFNGATWDRQVKANATSRIISSAASTNATSAKASAGNVFMATGRNTNAAVLYLKIYNKASAPTVGTDTPVQTFVLPPQANFALDWASGRYFATGIAYAFTTGGADADTGAVGAGDIVGFNLDYS